MSKKFGRDKYRFSRYRYTIPLRKTKNRIRRQKLLIDYEIHLGNHKGKFCPFFLVRYLLMVFNPRKFSNLIKLSTLKNFLALKILSTLKNFLTINNFLTLKTVRAKKFSKGRKILRV